MDECTPLLSGFAAGLDLIAVCLTMMLFSPVLATTIMCTLPFVVVYNKAKAGGLFRPSNRPTLSSDELSPLVCMSINPEEEGEK